MNVRNLRTNESMPDGIETGFEKLRVMPEWCWIAEHEGEPMGVLMGAPCHGIVYLVRLCVKHGIKNNTVPVALFRAFMRDCKERGFLAYFTHLDPTRDVERRMIGLCRQANGAQVTSPQVAVIGFVADAARY
jgi:hypothetical protein